MAMRVFAKINKKLVGAFGRNRLAPTVTLVAVVLMASWMGDLYGGYFVGAWAPVALVLAALALLASAFGLLRGGPGNRSGHGSGYRWGFVALGLLAAYTAWTFASLLWASNRGDAWHGAGQTMLYFLVFWVSVVLLALGASRRWVLAASVAGPSLVAALTLPALLARPEDLFENDRLIGTVGYYNGEAAFLLVPFWVATYLAGSPRVNAIGRAGVLVGATLCLELAVLTQSRGALVAMAVSLPVFFLFSGQRLRGLLALIPLAIALAVAFPALNAVYLEFLNDGTPTAALGQAYAVVWLTAAGAGLYGLLWGLLDARWRPRAGLVRGAGVVAVAGCLALLVVGAAVVEERSGGPVELAQQRWEAFRTDDRTGQDQSRFLSASGSGRFELWEVAWEGFVSHPVLGVGTHNYEATYYQERDRVVGYVRQPHVLPLEVLAERGVVGGALFFGFLIVCVASGLWQRFRLLNAEGKAQVGALVAAVTYWFVHSGAEWFWQIPAVTMPAVIYLAVLVLPWRRVETEPLRWPWRAAGAGVAALAVAAIVPLYAADHYLSRSNDVTSTPEEALVAVERARSFNPASSILARREAELATQVNDRERAEAAYREAIELNPEHYVPYTMLARFYEEQGEDAKALELYEEALTRNPLDEDLRQRMSELEDADSR